MTRVADIKPNPFRHLDRYPIRREKVEALKASINSTGFWDNIVARAGEDGPQIAYGHHRLIAVREELGEDAEVGLILRELDDATMLKIMAAENMQEWEASAEIDQETLRAVIEAYGADLISLDSPSPKARGIHVVLSQNQDKKPYTAENLSSFLGWNLGKVQRALRVLDAIEDGTLREEDTNGLRPSGADKLATATKDAAEIAERRGASKAKAKKVAAKIATEVANDLKAERIPSGASAIKLEVLDRLDKEVPRPPKEPLPSKVVDNLIGDVDRFWKGNVTGSVPLSSRETVAKIVAANRNSLSLGGMAKRSLPLQLADALRRMATTATKYADLIEDETAVEVPQ